MQEGDATGLNDQAESNGKQQNSQGTQDLPDAAVCETQETQGEWSASVAQNSSSAQLAQSEDAQGERNAQSSQGAQEQQPVQPVQRAADSVSPFEELVAAEVQLKAAQERYAAAKARVDAVMASPSGGGRRSSSPSEDERRNDPQARADAATAAQASTMGSAPSSPSSPSSPSGYVPPSHLHSHAQSRRAGSATPPPVRPAEPSGQTAYTYQYSSTYVPPRSASSASPHPHSPYAQNGYASPAMAPKDHVAAGLLAIFLGWLGIHKFYLGYNTAGFTMLAVAILGSLLSFGLAAVAIWIIAIVEGVLYLGKSQTDFEQVYVFGHREWF